MLTTFIKRPVLSIVISIIILLMGGLAVFRLPVTQYPDIAPPAVTVTTTYTGANAATCAKAVVTPLERAINGVAGMTYMTSISGNDGTSIIQVYFKVGIDPDVAAVNVQNRVATVMDELPEEVIKAGVITEKEVNSMLMYLNLVCNDEHVDEKFVFNFADINILPELKRIEGVGFIDIMGQREYSMRVWLKPDRMAVYGVSANDIIDALRSQNVEAAPGKIGLSSGKNAQSLQYVLTYTGKYTEKEQFENIVIRANSKAEVLHLKDIAEIEFGSLDYDVISMENGKPSAAILIKQRPGSNAKEVIENIKSKMEELKESSFPPIIDYTISYDVSRFLDASIHEVIRTLIEAFILVAIVVFLFLQDFRSTLIPALAVPVSLIGTFFFMQLFGFSINLLTLFALVLAIGIVIDDAIVVVEAVHAKMDKLQLPAKEATIQAMKEINGAIVAITLVMAAVFVPVAFMDGPTGVFFKQFSLTLAISITISGVNALTLTPALCAMFLKNNHKARIKRNLLDRFFLFFNRKFAKLTNRYSHLLRKIINRRVVTFGLLSLFIALTLTTNTVLPSGFIPNEDQGTIYASVTTPPGATVERTQKVVQQVQQVSSAIEAVESVSTLAGFNVMTDGSGASFGMVMINLKPWKERGEDVNALIRLLRKKTSFIKDASIQFFPPPAVPGYGNAGGFEFRIQAKNEGENFEKLQALSDLVVKKLSDRPEVSAAYSSFDAGFPQYMIHIDNEKAAYKGVTIKNAMSNLQALIGSYYATNFIRYGQMYKVMVQSLPSYRDQPDDILHLHVKNEYGEMVPYTAFATIERVYGPEQLTRYNMYTSAMINGDAAQGYSSSDAIEAIKQVTAETLPRGYTIDWSGMTRDEVLSGNQKVYVFVLCLVFVYLLLAAQYDSFLLPFPVLLSLPTGVFGAFLLLYLFGLENNIYAQVALVMLIGLLGKNAILIVEFAIQKQKEGIGKAQAAIKGAGERLRPILMTSFAFIAGLIPLILANGAGAIGNRTIGTAAAGGMLLGTLFGLVIVPGLYIIFAQETIGYHNQKNGISSRKALQKRLAYIRKNGAQLSMLLLAFTFTGCKVPQETQVSTNIDQLPETYALSQVSEDSLYLSIDYFIKDTVLLQLIDEGLDANYDLLTGYQNIMMAAAQVHYRKGKLYPTLSATPSLGIRKYGDYTEEGVGNYDTQFSPYLTEDQQIPTNIPDSYLGLQSSWEIDFWGKLRNKKKQAIAKYLASIEGQKWLKTNIITQVSKAYFELLALDHELDIIRETGELQKEALEIVQLQKKVGHANQLAVEQFEAQYLYSKGLEVEVLQKITETENRINLLLGRYPQKVPRNKQAFEEAIPDTVTVGLPTDLLQNRPDIKAAAYQLIASKANLKASKAAFYPTFKISANLGLQTFNPSFIVSPQSLAYHLLGGLTMPLLNKAQIKANFKQANAKQVEAMYNYQNNVLHAYMEVYNKINNIQNYQKLYEIKEQEVEVLTKSINTSSELFYTGRATYYEIILSQKNALVSRLELIEVKKKQLSALLDLYKALGGYKEVD